MVRKREYDGKGRKGKQGGKKGKGSKRSTKGARGSRGGGKGERGASGSKGEKEIVRKSKGVRQWHWRGVFYYLSIIHKVIVSCLYVCFYVCLCVRSKLMILEYFTRINARNYLNCPFLNNIDHKDQLSIRFKTKKIRGEFEIIFNPLSNI